MRIHLRHVVGIADMAFDQLEIRITTKRFIDLRANPPIYGINRKGRSLHNNVDKKIP